MRRKLFIVLLTFVLAIAFASCGNSSTGSIEGETDDTEEEINVPISWIVEPTNEYDDFDELTIDFGIYCGDENENYYHEFGSCVPNKKGYPQQWYDGLKIDQPAGVVTGSFSYDPGALSVKTEDSEGSRWGIIDYEGNIRHVVNIDSPITGNKLVTLQGIGYRDTTTSPEMIESRYHILSGDYSEIEFSGYLPTGVAGPDTYYYFCKDTLFKYHIDADGVKDTTTSEIPDELRESLVRINDSGSYTFFPTAEGYMYISIDNTPVHQDGYYFKNFVNGYYVAFETAEDSINKQFTEDYQEIYLSPKCIIKASTGERITECIYEDALYFEEGYCPVKKDGKWGLINEDGEEITGFVFDKMSSVYDGKVAVMIDGQFGIINFGDATEVSKEAFGEFLANINNQ